MTFNGSQNTVIGIDNQNLIFNNLLNSNINEIETIEDVYPYITDEKKNITFIRYDNSTKKVKIPKSLRKNELYSTANLYKIHKYSDILLSYNGLTLNEDESLINDIPEGSEIYIIEELKDIDSQYYKKYLEKHNNEKKISILFETDNGLMRNMIFTLNTTIEEIIKIYLFEMNIPEKYKNNYNFICNAEIINNESSTLSKKNILENSKILVSEKNSLLNNAKKGKALKATIKYHEKNFSVNIGTLNQIKELFTKITNLINIDQDKTLEIKGKHYKIDDNNTFSAIGIRKDFVCKIKDGNKETKKRKDPSSCVIF